MILITGGGGLLGRALAEQLTAEGAAVEVVSSRDVDLRDREQTGALFERVQPKIVFHLAARVHGLGGNKRFPAEMYTDNIRINTNVIECASRTGVKKIVAASTVAVFPPDAAKPVAESAIWNGEPHPAEAAYGHAKRAMLAQLEAYAAQHDLSYAYAILTNLYGPHDRFDPINGHVVPSLIAKFHKAIASGSTVEVWGSGIAERDFMFASDAARAMRLIADRHTGPINVVTGRTVKIRNVVEALQAHTGMDRVNWDKGKPDGELVRSYDTSKLRSLGFDADVELGDGLAKTYDWYADHYPNVRTN